MRALLLALCCILLGATGAWAQATATPVPTATPTPTIGGLTYGAKPLVNRATGTGVVGKATGASTGTKTLGVLISGTSATVKAKCTVGGASAYVGSPAQLTATGIITVTDSCDTLQLDITACTDCLVSGWASFEK